MDLTLPPPLAEDGASQLGRAGTAEKLNSFLDQHCASTSSSAAIYDALAKLVQSEFRTLPQPAAGVTLARWNALSEVASRSLPLVKLYEAHTDAAAILTELGAKDLLGKGSWGVFAAETKPPQLFVREAGNGEIRLDGRKAWCSGAKGITHALLTVRDHNGASQLAALELDPDTVTICDDGWQAVGMGLTRTSVLEFTDARATPVGAPNAYLERSGFWQGAIGVAACWYGGARTLVQTVVESLNLRNDAHGLAHFGAITAYLLSARNGLRHAAASIDRQPNEDARTLALATRAIVEDSCTHILEHAGRALGARPFCEDARFAAMAADLPVFLRQSHAERDLEQLGAALLKRDATWMQLNSH